MKTTDTPRFARTFARFRLMVWAAFALTIVDGLLSSTIAALPSPVREIVLGVAVLLFAFAAWLNVLLLRGRNWVRIFWVVSMVAWLPPIMDWSTVTTPQLYMAIVEIALYVCIIYMMFTDPLRQHFARKDALAQPAGG
jgi:hypothetical protein